MAPECGVFCVCVLDYGYGSNSRLVWGTENAVSPSGRGTFSGEDCLGPDEVCIGLALPSVM